MEGKTSRIQEGNKTGKNERKKDKQKRAQIKTEEKRKERKGIGRKDRHLRERKRDENK